MQRRAHASLDNLASRRKGYDGSNEDLEDELRAAATGEKKKVDWRSELDTPVARMRDVDTARWAIDRALDPKPESTQPKTRGGAAEGGARGAHRNRRALPRQRVGKR